MKKQDSNINESAFILGDETGTYTTTRPVHSKDILDLASQILFNDLNRGDALSSPDTVKRYLACKLGNREAECFCVLFLDNRHRVIEFEELFQGTLNGCAVYPREVAKRALTLNAAALILAHNHPSGIPDPSKADEQLTSRLTEALGLFDIRILDHFIIGGADIVSFAERGLL